jgi:hypothetical protein
MSMGWDYVSELRPPAGLLSIPQMTYEYGEPRWNDIDRENWRTRTETRSSATLSNTHTTWTDPGAIQWHRGERPATNRLSHGTASDLSKLRLQVAAVPNTTSNTFCWAEKTVETDRWLLCHTIVLINRRLCGQTMLQCSVRAWIMHLA